MRASRCWRTQKNGGQGEQAPSQCLGGLNTKIHFSVDGLGDPLRFLLTAGHRHNTTQAEALPDDFLADYVVSDRPCDADNSLESVNRGAMLVLPPHLRRIEPRGYDKHWYKERHLVECFTINEKGHCRRIFSRFDKLASRYLGFLNFTGAFIWLR